MLSQTSASQIFKQSFISKLYLKWTNWANLLLFYVYNSSSITCVLSFTAMNIMSDSLLFLLHFLMKDYWMKDLVQLRLGLTTALCFWRYHFHLNSRLRARGKLMLYIELPCGLIEPVIPLKRHISIVMSKTAATTLLTVLCCCYCVPVYRIKCVIVNRPGIYGQCCF